MKGIMEFDQEFWEKIGGNLQYLKLRNCQLSIENLLNVLRLCPNLKSLNLKRKFNKKVLSHGVGRGTRQCRREETFF